MPRVPKRRFCCICGADIGVYADYDPHDTCGKRECDREAADLRQAERDEAHRRLDQDMGF